jgi:alkanesulfonate monooxygenase SsuD/methylene tetrahydromethanopterin reductase-like flavin-dependent oxidoreductase (luciferase family)
MKIRFAVGPQTASLTAGTMTAFAEAIEDSGFDGIWLSDLPVAPVLDPLLGLALAAGRTRGLRLGANVVPLGRNPFLLAKELAQLDQLSGGRLLLSFVTGLGQPGECEALGLGGAARGAVLEEVQARRSPTAPSAGRSPSWRAPPGRSRSPSRYGWAAAVRGRLTVSAGWPTDGWARSSPRPRPRSPGAASSRPPTERGARSTPSISG